MREFSLWMDSLPESVPVVLVMAQCYCGGFAHSLFEKGDREEGLSTNVRTGFFAQRHDLPAAGCRPDIENDEEYSSYFWGALSGKSRNGKPIADVDCNGDGRVALAEAHAYAVVASETIDIPLAGSDALLREFSRIANYESDDIESAESLSDDATSPSPLDRDKKLSGIDGTLGEMAGRGSSVQKRIVTGLAERLGISLSSNVDQVFDGFSDAARELRNLRRGFGPGRRSRGGFGRRRDLREDLVEKWPELADQSKWAGSQLLAGTAGESWLKEVEQLASYQAYVKGRDERERTRKQSLEAEIRQVRFQRLIHTLESIALTENLKQLAPGHVVERFHQMIAQENRYFD